MGFYSKIQKPEEEPLVYVEIGYPGLECILAAEQPDPEPKVGEYNPDMKYKILVHQIVNHTVIIPTPLGLMQDGLSKLHSGYQVIVKERSPREDYDESQDVEDLTSVHEVIAKYQKKYKVKDSDIYGV